MANGTPTSPCCNLVGNLTLTVNPSIYAGSCITSVSADVQTEVYTQCPTIQLGVTTGTLNVTGYASSTMYRGCQIQSSVSIPWVRRWDCTEDQIYFLFPGQKKCRASIMGDPEEMPNSGPRVTIGTSVSTGNSSINASAQGGPATIYTCANKEEGYGLKYEGGGLWEFNTATGPGGNGVYLTSVALSDPKAGTECEVRSGNITIIDPNGTQLTNSFMLLQNFSLNLTPGELPTVSYTYIYAIDN